jgi:hypothetical protein
MPRPFPYASFPIHRSLITLLLDATLQGWPQRDLSTSLVRLAQITFNDVWGFKKKIFYLIDIILDKRPAY